MQLIPTNSTVAESLLHLPYLPYNYVPTEWVCTPILVLFSLSGLVHMFQAFYYRLWFLLPTVVLADGIEVIGWSGRLWSSKNPYLLRPFIMQITTTIIAPTPLVAANFLVLGELIKRLGPQYSRLRPAWYASVFVGFDVVALVVQAVGGGDASQASVNHESPDTGGHIMLAGIVLQLAAIAVYMTLAAEFVLRYLHDRPLRKISQKEHDALHALGRRYKLMLLSLGFSTTCVFIRSVYRTCELSNGWSGRVISTQHLFNICDAAMILLATYTMNVLHPGFLMGCGSQWTWGNCLETHPAVDPEKLSESTEKKRGPGATRLNLWQQSSR